MKFRSGKFVLSTLAASVLALGAASGTHAAVYSGSWDPAFGAPFAPAFGWRATADLFVPDTCVQAVGSGTVTLGTRLTSFSATSFGAYQDCQDIVLRNTQLLLYDTNPAAVFETLDIGTYATASESKLYGGSAFEMDDQLLYLVTFVDGIVTDFQTSASLLQDVADVGDPCPASGAGFPCYDEYRYSLRLSNTNGEAFPDNFSIDGPEAAMTSTAAQTQGTGGQPYAALRAVFDDGEPEYRFGIDSSNPPLITFRQVPEPGSLALVGAALAGLGLARRRKFRNQVA